MTRTLGPTAKSGWTLAAGTLLAASFMISGAKSLADGAPPPSCFVTLVAGDVQGVDAGASCLFSGIPYAASTGGSNRWRPPEPAAPWAPGVFNANTAPLSCASLNAAGMPTGSEDCLKLNVWARNPLPAIPAPVIVWIHTGSFTSASANIAGTNGRVLAEETGAIVVAPNYRLGPFGFLAHPALAAEDPHGSAGNYGLLDQQAALRWVRDNIAQFGGDPSNVTLAGTSAGGQSVGLQLVSPASEGLIHRAIVESAYPTTRWTSASEALAVGDAFATALDCTDPTQVLACLRAQMPGAILSALPLAAPQVVVPAGRVVWEPTVDGMVIPDQPRVLFEMGAFHRVPTIIGFNRDEGWGAFVTRSFPSGVTAAQYESWVTGEFGPDAASVLHLYPSAAFPSPAEAMARVVGDAQFACEAVRLVKILEQYQTPAYLYSFEYEIDALSLDHVIHGIESNIVFGNDYAPPQFASHPLDATDLALHAQIAGYWTRFAATGNPNAEDDSVVHWPAFRFPSGPGRGSGHHIVFDTIIRQDKRSREAQCSLFEPFFLRSLLGALPASQ